MSQRFAAVVLIWALFMVVLAIRQHHQLLQPVTATGPIVWSTPR